MLKILMVCNDLVSLTVLADALSKRDMVTVEWVKSKEGAMASILKERPQVVVVCEELTDGSSLPLVKEIVSKDPFINCAMVSALPKQDFHEMTEGLGVFMQLPVYPGAEEADRMLNLLESIGVQSS